MIDALKNPNQFKNLAIRQSGTQVPGPFTIKRSGFNFSSRMIDCDEHIKELIIEGRKLCFTSLARLTVNQATSSEKTRFSCSTWHCECMSVVATTRKNGPYCSLGNRLIKESISLVCPPEPKTIITFFLLAIPCRRSRYAAKYLEDDLG